MVIPPLRVIYEDRIVTDLSWRPQDGLSDTQSRTVLIGMAVGVGSSILESLLWTLATSLSTSRHRCEMIFDENFSRNVQPLSRFNQI